MKKMFFFALAAAGMLTACSNEDTLGGNGEQNVSEQQIRLGVASSKVQTRGTGTVGGMTDTENVWAGQTLWVYMLQKGSMELALYKSPAVGATAAAETEVFNNKKFTAPTTVTSGLATTADGTIAYYPVSGNYDFWGYRVDDAVAGGTPTVKTVGDDGTEVEANVATKRVVDITIDGSQDIMAGKAVPSTDEVTKLGGYAENFYSAYAARKGVQPNITFNHLLTRFTFEVRAGSKATAGLPAGGNTDAVKVTGVSVDSKTTGTLTVAYTGATKEAAELLTFTGNASALTLRQRNATAADNNAQLDPLQPVSLTWPADDDAATVGDVIKIGEALLVAPGETEYPLTIALSQDVLQKVGETKVTMPLEQKAVIKMDGVKKFEPGKSYKVTITVYGLEDIRVTATLVPWADGGSIDIDDDRDPNGGIYTEPTVTPAP